MPVSSKKNPFKTITTFLQDHSAACLLCLGVFFFWSVLLIRKYLNLGYDDWDMAYFNQATWNLLHGNNHVSLFDSNFFGNHANLIAYVIMPIYALCAHPLTLVCLKLLSIIGGGIVFYKIIAKDLGKGQSLFLLALYFLYPANIFGILYEFDYESLCPLFLFILYDLWRQSKYKKFLLLALVTMSIKENMPLIILAFGLLTLLRRTKKDILWGGAIILVAITVFYYLVDIFIPSFRQGQPHAYLGYYKDLGGSPLQIALNLLTHPGKITAIIFQPLNMNLLFNLFSPVLFLCFGSLTTLFLASPIILQHLLSVGDTNHYIYFQYGIAIAPFIFLALSQTLNFLQKHVRAHINYFILVFILVLSLANLETHRSMLVQRTGLTPDPIRKWQWAMIKKIPAQAPTLATFTFLSELSNRSDLYAFFKIHFKDFQQGEKPFNIPPQVNYALIDFNNPWLNFDYSHDPGGTNQRIQKFYTQGDWGVIDSAQDTVLFKRGEPQKLLQRMPVKEWQGKTDSHSPINTNFSLISFAGPAEPLHGDTLWPLKFVWHSQEKISNNYDIVLRLDQDGRNIYSERHKIGYKIYPTSTWTKEEIIVENYNLYVPPLAPGNYKLSILFIDATLDSQQFITTATANGKNTVLSFKLMDFQIQ